MEEFDRLVVSLIDSEALKGCFKRELAKTLHIPINTIKEVWLDSEVIDGLVQQVVKVSFIDVEISKEKLMELPFKSIYENTIIFEVGDILL